MSRNLDFLGIGAQKAGTTWLHHNLSRHPDVRMPPVKELHFFDEAESGNKQSIIYKLVVKNKFNGVWKRNMIRGCSKSILSANMKELIWCIKYGLLPHTFETKYLEQYDNLFSSEKKIITGEITPAYSALSEKSISIIKNFYPDLRIILILRDPVDRAWSQLRMGMKNKGKKYFNHQRILNFMNQNSLRGNYPRIIQNWTKAYEDNLLILFYDELKSEPQKIMGKISNFLGLSKFVPNGIEKQLNVGIEVEFSPVYRKMLIEKYIRDVEYLSNWFRSLPLNYPSNWLKNYYDFLGTPD